MISSARTGAARTRAVAVIEAAEVMARRVLGGGGGGVEGPPCRGGRVRWVDETLNALGRGGSARAEGSGGDPSGSHGQQGPGQGEPVLAADRSVVSGGFDKIADLTGRDRG